jgi:hypothetical protein
VFSHFQQGDLFLPYSLGGEPLRVDAPILGFAIVVSLLTGGLVGLIPGLRASRVDLQVTLKEDQTAVDNGAAAPWSYRRLLCH